MADQPALSPDELEQELADLDYSRAPDHGNAAGPNTTRFGDVTQRDILAVSTAKDVKVATKQLAEAVQAAVRGMTGDGVPLIEFAYQHTLDLKWGFEGSEKNTVSQKIYPDSKALVIFKLQQKQKTSSAKGLFCCCKEHKRTLEGQLQKLAMVMQSAYVTTRIYEFIV
eukprot:g1025.t1